MSGTRHCTTDDTFSSMRLNGNLTIDRFRKRLQALTPGNHSVTNQFSLPHGNNKISSERILNLGAGLPLDVAWLGSDRFDRIFPSVGDPRAIWPSSAIRLGPKSAQWAQLVHYGIASALGVRSDLLGIPAPFQDHLVVWRFVESALRIPKSCLSVVRPRISQYAGDSDAWWHCL